MLRYVKSAPGQGLHFPNNNSLVLEAYCDADWGGCALTRRSTIGYFIKLGDSPIAWRTKKQQVVSRSSAEAEYRAMATTVSEVVWLHHLLKEFGVDVTESTRLYCDNQAALHIASNPVFHERTKHVEMDCHFVRERVISKEIKPHNISTKDQLADLFTKALGQDRLRYLLGKLGVHDLHAPA
ncbi:Retrovirus-related Pol polyprotein from transposon RE1 [Linum grandiflorum]